MPLEIGNVLRLDVLRPIRYHRPPSPLKWSKITHKPLKGEHFVVLLLGVAKHEEPINADAMLNDMGWFLAPEPTAEEARHDR